MSIRALFRWRPAALVLWLFALLFAAAAVLDVWLATRASRSSLPVVAFQDPEHPVRALLLGSAENAVISACCMGGWYLMRRRIAITLLAGSVLVMAALFITFRRWMHWEVQGHNPGSWVEPLLVWPFFLYAILYGYIESRAQQVG